MSEVNGGGQAGGREHEEAPKRWLEDSRSDSFSTQDVGPGWPLLHGEAARGRRKGLLCKRNFGAREKEVSVGMPQGSAFGLALSAAFVNKLDEEGEGTFTSFIRLTADTQLKGSRERRLRVTDSGLSISDGTVGANNKYFFLKERCYLY